MQNNQCEVKQDAPVRFHQLLPTIAETKNNSQEIFSDHLWEIFTNKGNVFLIANILTPNLGSGFALFEDEHQYNARARRIIDGLHKIVARQNIAAICVQEYWFNKELEDLLLKKLGSKWEVHRFIRNATFYNKDKLSIEEAHDNNSELFRECSSLFAQISESTAFNPKLQLLEFKDFMLVNAHLPHAEYPCNHNLLIKELLDILHSQVRKEIYFLADTNMRCVNPDRVKRKVIGITNVVPPQFRDGKQGVDYVHIALYSPEQNIINQMATQVVNYNNGLTVPDCLAEEYLKQFPIGSFQYEEVVKFRPAINIEYKDSPIVGKLNIMNFCYFLRKYFNEKEIFISFATNGISELGITISFTQASFDCFKKILANNPLSISIQESSIAKCRQVSLLLDDANLLYEHFTSIVPDLKIPVSIFFKKSDKRFGDKKADSSDKLKSLLQSTTVHLTNYQKELKSLNNDKGFCNCIVYLDTACRCFETALDLIENNNDPSLQTKLLALFEQLKNVKDIFDNLRKYNNPRPIKINPESLEMETNEIFERMEILIYMFNKSLKVTTQSNRRLAHR